MKYVPIQPEKETAKETNIETLKPWIIEDLARSGLSEKTVKEMYVQNLPDNEIIKDLLGFQCIDHTPNETIQVSETDPPRSIDGEWKHISDLGGYIIPYPATRFVRVKLAQTYNGMKYLSPRSNNGTSPFHLYYLRTEKEKLGKLNTPMIITEGEKKAAKLTQEIRNGGINAAAIGLPGVTMWNDLDLWKDIPLQGRNIYICFDCVDFLDQNITDTPASNPNQERKIQVVNELIKLFLFLRKKGATPKIMTWDITRGGKIDDYLVNFTNPSEELKTLLTQAKENPFEMVKITHKSLAHMLAGQFYSVKEDSRALWDDFSLSQIYEKLKWSTFKAEISKEYRQKIEREKKENGKPYTIKIVPGELSQNVSDSEKYLIEANCGIYQRAGMLVMISERKRKATRKNVKASGCPIIMPVTVEHLREIMTRKINYIEENFSEGEMAWHSINCPKLIAETLMARPSWDFPILNGIVHMPILHDDGSVFTSHGYDEMTGLFFDTGEISFPSIPVNPSLSDAKEAIKKIKKVIEFFPFVSNVDRSVSLASIFTGLARHLVKTSPLFGFTAPKPRSGKSLLADVVALIATGHPCAVISQADSPEEEKKSFLSLLIENEKIINIDNCEKPLNSDSLCSILTQEFYRARLLGMNKTVTVETGQSIWLATGNGLTFAGDLSARALLCTIDPQCEKPEERPFPIDIYEYVGLNRPELVVAGLTVLRAYIMAGMPPQAAIKPFGGFEDWSNLIRSGLVWIGEEDPNKSKEKIEDGDSVREGLKALLSVWYDVRTEKRYKELARSYDRQAISLKALTDYAEEKVIIPTDVTFDEQEALEKEAAKRLRLKDAMLLLADDKGVINKIKLGKAFKKFVGRIESCTTETEATKEEIFTGTAKRIEHKNEKNEIVDYSYQRLLKISANGKSRDHQIMWRVEAIKETQK